MLCRNALRRVVTSCGMVVFLLATQGARGGDDLPCEPQWVPTFGGHPHVPSSVTSLLVWDNGTGSALYIGGSGNINTQFVLRWDGHQMITLAHTLAGPVNAMAVFDDGTGEALYVGGNFESIAGVEAHNIARWDGEAWSAVGNGLEGGPVHALYVFDDGSGAALYAGGGFNSSGGTAINRVVRWDGAAFSSVGAGLNSDVYALAGFDDGSGSGPSLYAGGTFTDIQPNATRGMARWDGAQWTSVGLGVSQCNMAAGPCTPGVFALAAYDDGTGPALYAGGRFIMAGSAVANGLARWDGTVWGVPGVGLNPQGPHAAVQALHVRVEEGEEVLFAGGKFLFHLGQPDEAYDLLRWDGETLSGVSDNSIGDVHALTSFDDGSGGGSELHISGSLSAHKVYKITNGLVQPLGPGMNDDIRALAVFNDGSGDALYAAGDFVAVDGVIFNRIAKWMGAGWESLGPGLNGPVHALEVFDDGSGSALFAGGEFTFAGDLEVNRVAKWDGTAWTALADGVGSPGSDETVYALTAFDDALYVGGSFLSAGGRPANRVARWDGELWSALGEGSGSDVRAVGVFDDGSGPHLYAGGFYVSDDREQGSVGKWNGASWEPIGAPIAPAVLAIATFSDGWGTDPDLYIGTAQASSQTPTVRRLETGNWVGVGAGVHNDVNSLTVFADGASGLPALFACGKVFSGGTVDVRIARWNGFSWQFLDQAPNIFFGYISTSIVYDDGNGPSLLVAGDFNDSPSDDAHLALYRGCPTDALLGDVNNDGAVTPDDRQSLCALIGSTYGEPSYYLGADLNQDGTIDHLDLGLLNQVLPPCLGDTVSSNSLTPPPDGVVDGADLAYLLSQWGIVPTCADFVSSATFAPPPDGVVDSADLAVLLGAWGACE